MHQLCEEKLIQQPIATGQKPFINFNLLSYATLWDQRVLKLNNFSSFLKGLKLNLLYCFKEELCISPFTAQTKPLQLTGWLLWPTKVNTSSLMCNFSYSRRFHLLSHCILNTTYCIFYFCNWLFSWKRFKEQFSKYFVVLFFAFLFCTGPRLYWKSKTMKHLVLKFR